MNKIKIIYVITKSNWGGAQRYVYDLATSLPHDLYDVEVIVGGAGALFDKLKTAGIQVTSLADLGRDINVRGDLKVFRDLIRIFRDKKPHIVHLNSSKIGAIGALAARLTGVPQIIFTAHGWAFNNNLGFISKSAFKFIHWLTLVLCHKTIAVSENIQDRVALWPFTAGKMTVVHNGIAHAAIFTRASAQHELLQKNSELGAIVKNTPTAKLIWLGTIAELHPVKGYDVALRAIRLLLDNPKFKSSGKRLVYTIIGEGEERKRLLEITQELGLSEHVFFLGHVDAAAHYMKAFDIFLLASRSEALAYVLLEAGLAQISCVATAVGGIPEIIDDMKNGVLIQPNKAAEIAHALEFLIEHKHIRKEYAEALHQKVLTEFTITSMLEATKKVYEVK